MGAQGEKGPKSKVRAGRYPMTAGENGWWFTELSLAETNADYAFVLDGGQPLRIRVPLGSRAEFMDLHALSITTLLHGGINIGRRRRFQPRLSMNFISAPLLRKELSSPPSIISTTWFSSGITHIELMPVAEFPEAAAGA